MNLASVEGASPDWSGDGLFPVCSSECPSHDGKRCRLIGFQPSSVCEPVVREANRQLRSLAQAASKVVQAADGRNDIGCAVRSPIEDMARVLDRVYAP